MPYGPGGTYFGDDGPRKSSWIDFLVFLIMFGGLAMFVLRMLRFIDE
jgi:hypothetical protein